MTLDEGAGVPLRDHAVGPYVLRERIAKGGMGEVFRAHDRHLDREVAIKILPLELTSSAERLERLQREARLLASLNHRNIATVHGLEISGGVVALVMELLEGTTLAERLSQGRLPVAEVLDIAGQLADGLEAAHAKGIIHRDLKPANVMVTSAGVVKILDFGIAKHVVDASPTAVVDAPTRATTYLTDQTPAGSISGEPRCPNRHQLEALHNSST